MFDSPYNLTLEEDRNCVKLARVEGGGRVEKRREWNRRIAERDCGWNRRIQRVMDRMCMQCLIYLRIHVVTFPMARTSTF